MIYNRTRAVACPIGDEKIFIIGGYNNLARLDTVEMLNILSNTVVVQEIKYPFKLSLMGTFQIYKNVVLIFGGNDGTDDTAACFSFDGERFSDSPQLPSSMEFICTQGVYRENRGYAMACDEFLKWQVVKLEHNYWTVIPTTWS